MAEVIFNALAKEKGLDWCAESAGFAAVGDRPLALCRELTKLNEELCRTTVKKAAALYEEREPRGEYVLILGGASDADEEDYPSDPREHVELLEAAGLSRMDAIKAAAKARGVKKNEIYALLAKRDGDEE